MPPTNPARYRDPVRATRTKREAARLLGCGAVKVTELIEDGTLQAVKIGNRAQPTVASIERVLGKPIEELERHLEKPLTELADPHPALRGNAA
jgi:excisionase family DNA binding protein